jgi:hypothetical protein
MDRFIVINLNYDTNLFDELANSVIWNNVTNGRKGAILVDCKDGILPIVRTTTIYNKPVQSFSPIHYKIINSIKNNFSKNVEFNNGLIEIYDRNYRSMKFHSDQSLDLVKDSYIGIFSCYDCDKQFDIRTLKIQEKATGNSFEIKLEPNSVVLFSYETNYKYLHKIILESNTNNNKWLGITFRLSNTFIKFIDGKPIINSNNKELILANYEQKKEFYEQRSKENNSIEFEYPEINYTISPSDLMNIN